MTLAAGWYGRSYRLAYPATPGQALRTEQVLATGRAYLSAWSALAVVLDPPAHDATAPLTRVLFIGYAVCSALLLLMLRRSIELDPRTPLLIHAADILWATTATAATGGLASPFFPLFMFTLLSAAYRWGSRETLATAVAGVALLGTLILLASALEPALRGSPSSRTLLTRSGFLLVMAYLLGYLADEERRSEAESAILGRVTARLRDETGLTATLEALLGEIARLFAAREVVLAVNDADQGRAYLWEASREGEAVQQRRLELAAGGRARYLFEPPGDAWCAKRREGIPGASFTLLALDERGARVVPRPLPVDCAAERARSSVVAASVVFSSALAGRLLVVDPLHPARELEVRLLQSLLRHAAPAVYGAHLGSRLQARAGVVERARVARELHDGVIQSLIGLEMQVDVLRQQALSKAPDKAGALTHIQALLRDEIITVRELMEQMRAVEVGPTELVDRLAAIVDRFGRETGISARFVSDVEEVSLPPRLCGEITRIVQEALVNVRRHSKAAHVVVRLDRHEAVWSLAIDDDGAGFDFAGRLDLARLDAEHRGPLVIKERVRSAGAQLTIESRPGQGSRLEVLISPERHG